LPSGAWNNKFNPEETKAQNFFVSPEKTSNVSMMFKEGEDLTTANYFVIFLMSFPQNRVNILMFHPCIDLFYPLHEIPPFKIIFKRS
jgi:Serpin (serine protease inhibitor)